MNTFPNGTYVKLRKGSPLMEVLMQSTSKHETYVCGWYDGAGYCQSYHQARELKKV